MRLATFYGQSEPAETDPGVHLDRIEAGLRSSWTLLAEPVYRLPATIVQRTTRQQLDFLDRHRDLLCERVRSGRVIDAHGDLRPEHVCLEPEPVIIDCLEFHRDFRVIDAADDLSFLALECEVLGAPRVGRIIFEVYENVRGDQVPASLIDFYESARASLRARICLLHADEPGDHAPEHWLDRGREYLKLSAEHASETGRL